MRSYLFVFCLLFLCVSGARASCLNDFVECVRNNNDKWHCFSDLLSCANGKCLCFDVASGSAAYCAMTANSTAALELCLKQFVTNYRTCIANCKQQQANFTGLHATEATMISFPSLSKFTICKALVGLIEKYGIGKGCPYIATKLGDVCGPFGSLCKSMFNAICSAAIDFIEKDPSASPSAVCTYLGFGPKSSVMAAGDYFYGAASMVTINGDTMAEFVDRSTSFPESSRPVSTASCWPASDNSGNYTCMEKFQIAADIQLSGVAQPDSSSNSSSNTTWSVVAGVFAILTFVTALVILFVVSKQGKSVGAAAQQSGYVSMANQGY